MRRTLFFLLIFFIYIVFMGCSIQNQVNMNEEGGGKLFVSSNFGREIICDEKVKLISGEDVLGLLGKYLKVETQYGGFIRSINDKKSEGVQGQQYDWFYYVNGVASNSSAKAYKLNVADTVFWDYHSWTGATFIPAIVGAYPEPFVSGFKGQNNGVLILYANSAKNEAKKLAGSLERADAKNVEVKIISKDQIVKRNKPTIVIGLWRELETEQDLKEICSRNIKGGIFAKFSQKGFEFLDFKGDKVEIHNKDVAAIVATGTGLGDANSLWIITALDNAGLKQAVDLLEKRPDSIRGFYGIGIVKEQVVRLPMR